MLSWRGWWPDQALAVDDMSDIKESVEDYLDRNQDSFDEFENPDDVYYDLIEQLDSLEVLLFWQQWAPPLDRAQCPEAVYLFGHCTCVLLFWVLTAAGRECCAR